MRIMKSITRCFGAVCSALIVGAFAAATLAAENPAPTPKPRPTPTGKVVITLDDGLLSQYEHGRSVMMKYGLPGTLFINTALIGDEPTEPNEPWATMSWTQIRAWKDMGWEIGAHSHSHVALPTVDEHQLREELGYPAALIAVELGQRPVSFASPLGEYNDAMIEEARKIYENHVGAWGGIENLGEGSNSLTGIDPYRVNRLIVERDTPVEDVCASVARAGKEQFLLVLGFHGIVPKPRDGADGKYDVSVDNFEEIARCTLGRVLQGSVEVSTIEEALRTIPHLMAAN